MTRSGRTLSLNAAVATLSRLAPSPRPRGRPASLAARCSRRRSRPTSASTASRSARLGRDHRLDRPRLRAPRRLRLRPLRGPADRDPLRRGGQAHATEPRALRLRRRVRPRPLPDPARGPHRGRPRRRRRPPCAAGRPQRLPALRAVRPPGPAARGARARARRGACARAGPPGRLDLRRRRRPADPATARPPQRGEARPDRPRAARDRPRTRGAPTSTPRATSPPTTRPVAAADGRAAAAEGGRRHLRPSAPGPRHRDGAQALRADRGRQRLRLVRLRRAEPRLGQRPADALGGSPAATSRSSTRARYSAEYGHHEYRNGIVAFRSTELVRSLHIQNGTVSFRFQRSAAHDPPPRQPPLPIRAAGGRSGCCASR